MLNAYLKNEISTSTKDVYTKGHFQIRSNIVSESVELVSDQDLSSELFIITNQIGESIRATSSDQKHINVSNLPQGLYFISSKKTTYPFVKMN